MKEQQESGNSSRSVIGSAQSFFKKQFAGEDPWELWALIGISMFFLQILCWILVFLKLGVVSIYAHALGISLLGTVTLPITMWGLVKTLFNPPALRRTRSLGFGALIMVGLLGNVPFIAPPLSTEKWVEKSPIQLPFDGEWVVLAGGDSKETNYHATTATFRWGYDFAVERDGKRFEGTGKNLEDFYCFGEPVLAAAAGKIATVVRDEPDTQPGEPTATAVLGNHVVLEIGPNEYLYYVHLRNESPTVAVGDVVEQGQKIGECGNSGRSVEPHLHIHLQNSLKFPFSESMPLRFSNYEADGKLVERGMPVGVANFEQEGGQRVLNRR